MKYSFDTLKTKKKQKKQTNRKTKQNKTKNPVITEEASRSVLEGSSSQAVTLLKKNIFIVIFKGF